MSELFFLNDGYNREEIGKKLIDLGYIKNEKYHIYNLGGNLSTLKIVLSDDKKGIIQIQGDYAADLDNKGKNSKHYSKLEKLAHTIKPKKIVANTLDDEVFPELSSK